jgi:NAD(P)-dependent dehydrogenase (short-subunit alcohol dehydrogenase family)
MEPNPFDLTGQVALVTGGNSGIGLGMAKALLAAGASVAIWGTNKEKNSAATEELRLIGDRVLALECDVSDRPSVEGAFAETLKTFGKVDACFANAAIAGSGKHSFLKMETAEWHRVVRTNLDGTFHTFQTAARFMAENGGGVLVGTTSTAAVDGAPRSQHYAASKGGMISLIRGLAVELARYNIRAHALMPGWIDTPMTKKFTSRASLKEPIRARIPLGRWGSADDLGGIAVYLASRAAAYHTGDTIVIDGGYSVF